MGKNRLREDAINIIFGAHLGFPPSLKQRYNCIFVNLEQLGEGGAKVSDDYMNLLTTSAVMDYDERNLAAYGCKPGDVPVVSFLAAPYLYSAESLPLEDRPIDLLFFGSINERRRSLFARIEALGWSVTLFDHPLYSEERDHFVKQAKAVLNCHFYETSRFEQARAFHTLSLGTPVVSERTGNTSPPAAFEHTVSWFDDLSLETFFEREFMTPEWLSSAHEKLTLFRSADEISGWQTAYEFGLAIQKSALNPEADQQPWQPTVMNLGSGKDYKLGWLNVDILERAQPDLVLDFGHPVELPVKAVTVGGGLVLLEEGSLDLVYANNVLEHVPDLPCLMTNMLALLKEEGILEIEVPFEKSLAAWQDPTHLRAMNQNSWVYYTDWFWYLGWFKYRFELAEFTWLNSGLQACEEGQAMFMRVKLKKIQTTPQERSVARITSPDFKLLTDDF